MRGHEDLKQYREPCSPGRFDPDRGRWVLLSESPDLAAGPAVESLAVDRLRLATFNTWFGELRQRRRHQALFDLLRDSRADVIGLQEIVPRSLKHLLEQDWVRAEYTCSDILGTTVDPYGVVVLSRLSAPKMVSYGLPSLMRRKLIVCEHVIHGQSLQVGVVHLESLRYSGRLRGQQLRLILPQLRKSDHAVLLGDCNFCSSWRKENQRVDPEFKDVWSLLRDGEPGYTVDTQVNRMRFHEQGRDKMARYDRIFLRSSRQAWQAHHIELLGARPLPDLPHVWPSDHLGLLAELHWKPSAHGASVHELGLSAGGIAG